MSAITQPRINMERDSLESDVQLGIVAKTRSDPKTLLERYRVVVGWGFVVSFFSMTAITKSHWSVDGLVSESLFVVGIVMAFLGCLGRIWCSLFIGGFKTKKLITCGPYSVCRNPLYFFSAVGAIGVACGSGTFVLPGAVALYFAVYYPGIIRAEERRLVILHGAEFRNYCAQVPAFFPRWNRQSLPEKYRVYPAIVLRSIVEATWFVWLTFLIHGIYQLHQRADILPTAFVSF